MQCLADRVRMARTRSGISTDDLDRKAGLAIGHTYKIETGKRLSPSIETVAAIASALGVSIDWLITGIK